MAFAEVEWGAGRKDDFISWIRNEIYQSEGDRSELERTWENHLLQWRAKFTDETLDYPYPGASNLELPLTDMHATPVLADMLQSFHASADYWQIVATRGDRVDFASPLREALTAIERKWLKMRKVNTRAFLENGVLGTAFYKNHWRSERRGRRHVLPDGTSERITREISHPSVEHVPIQRMWFPAYAWSLDFDAPGGAPWIAQEYRWSDEEWQRYKIGSVELPGFDSEAAEIVSNFMTDDEEAIRTLMTEEDEYEPFKNTGRRIFEVHARFDTQGDGVYEDIVVTLHPLAGKILRAIYFPNTHGRHPFHAINYLPGYGIYGIGLAEVDEWAQEASTQLLNAQIDNARLANTRMFSAPIGSMHAQDELVYPGKVWYLEPDEAIREVRLSELYPSGFNLIQSLVSFAEMRTGVSELRQGSLNGLPSRTPATSLLSILQEGNKRFDMIHAGVRGVHDEIGTRVLQNVAQRTKSDPYAWTTFFMNALGAQDASKALQVLKTPDVEVLEEAFGVQVSATSARVNKEVEKQNFIGMIQIATQIFAGLTQTAILYMQVQDPVVRATASASYVTGVDILGQLFDRFDIQNKDEFMGLLEQASAQMQGSQDINPNMMNQLQAQAGAMGLLGNAGGAPPAPVSPEALAAVLGIG